jgi:hypothetical protein
LPFVLITISDGSSFKDDIVVNNRWYIPKQFRPKGDMYFILFIGGIFPYVLDIISKLGFWTVTSSMS